MTGEHDVDFFAPRCGQRPEMVPVWAQYFTEKGRHHILLLSYLAKLALPHDVSAAWLWSCVGVEDRARYHFFEIWTRKVRGLPLEAALVLCTDRGPEKLVVRWTKNRFLPSAQEVARRYQIAREWRAVRRSAPAHFWRVVVPTVILALVAYHSPPGPEARDQLPAWATDAMLLFSQYLWVVSVPVAVIYFCSLCALSPQEEESKGPAYCPTG